MSDEDEYKKNRDEDEDWEETGFLEGMEEADSGDGESKSFDDEFKEMEAEIKKDLEKKFR